MNVTEIITPTLANLDALYAVEIASHSYPWSHSQLASCFSERYLNAALCLDRQVIGFYCADYLLGESTLMNICVAPQFRGQHYGRILLEHYLKHSQNEGSENWFLEVRQSNTVAQALYLAMGYRQTGLRKNYYQAGSQQEHAVLMHRTINK